MKSLWTLVLLGMALHCRADEIEPAVNTSSIAPESATPESAAAAAPVAAPAPVPPAARAVKGATPAAKQPAGRKSNARDEIQLDTTQITGNKELPKVMYIVPWKRPDIGDLGGGPAKSLIDEALAPVDRDVFRRQNRYFAALQSQTAAAPAKPTVAPAAGATITLPSRDEK
jgi:hypothetical protein